MPQERPGWLQQHLHFGIPWLLEEHGQAMLQRLPLEENRLYLQLNGSWMLEAELKLVPLGVRSQESLVIEMGLVAVLQQLEELS